MLTSAAFNRHINRPNRHTNRPKDENRRPPGCKECSEVPDSGDFRLVSGFSARSCPVGRRPITVFNRSAGCNRDAKWAGGNFDTVGAGQPSLHLLPPSTADRLEVAQSFARLEGVTAIVIKVDAVLVYGGGPVAVQATHDHPVNRSCSACRRCIRRAKCRPTGIRRRR